MVMTFLDAIALAPPAEPDASQRKDTGFYEYPGLLGAVDSEYGRATDDIS